jgi:hypothetical protein
MVGVDVVVDVAVLDGVNVTRLVSVGVRVLSSGGTTTNVPLVGDDSKVFVAVRVALGSQPGGR